MARLPEIQFRPQGGEAPSTAAIRPTDLGLGAAAQNLQSWDREREQTKDLQAKQQRQVDDKTAAPIVDALKESFGRQVAESAAKYDGRSSGWAQQRMADFEAQAAPILARTDLPPGTAAAVRRQVDAYRAAAAQHTIAIEGDKAGGVAAQQEAVRKSAVEGTAWANYREAYAAAVKPVDAAYDGSQPESDYVAAHLAAHDQAAAKVLEGVPEADRPTFQLKLDTARIQLGDSAQGKAQHGQQVFVVNQVRDAGSKLANAVRSSPALFDHAESDIQTAVASLPGEVRGDQARYLRNQMATARISGLMDQGQHEQALKELKAGTLDGWLAPEMKDRLLDQVKGDAAKRAADQIEAIRYGGDYDPAALERDAKLSGDPGLQARANYQLLVGADLPGDGQGAQASTGQMATFIIDSLEGGDTYVPNDNGKGPTRFGINQSAHPGVDIKNLTRPQATAIFQSYARPFKTLPAPLALVATDAAFNQGPDRAKQWLAQSHGDVGEYLAIREKAYRDLAASSPAQAKNLPGWLGRLKKVTAEAARYQRQLNSQDGVSGDPIAFAQGTKTRAALYAVPALPQDLAGEGWDQALKGRLAVGQAMNRTYQAPLRLLTDNEAKFYADMITRDPMAGLTLAQRANTAVGPVAARQLLSEVGKADQAGLELHLADLAAAGLQTYARQALTGAELKKQGVDLAKTLKDDIGDALDSRKGLFAGQAGFMATVRQTAELAALADQQSGKPKAGASYVASALGAANRGGAAFGGFAYTRGGEAIIPPWLRQDHADDAMEILAEDWAAQHAGPVFTSGKPMPPDAVARLRPMLMPSGKYRLVDKRGAAMLAPGGQPFEFDFDAARKNLRNRLGASAVLAGWQ